MTFQFKLDAAPTFEATVAIPVPGGTTAPVKFVFKHYKKDELADLFDLTPDHATAADRVRRLMFLEKLLHEIDDALASLEE